MINNSTINFILGNYKETQNTVNYKLYGNGHINETFLVETDRKNNYILQRVNKSVFRTEALVNNYKLFFSYLDEYQNKTGTKLTPEILKTKSGLLHVIDKDGFAWRLAEYIPNTKSYGISPNTDVSYDAAKAMGSFQRFLNNLPSDEFDYTIINYHNPENRLNSFNNAINKADKDLLKRAKKEIEFCRANQNIVTEYNAVAPKLPKRITHNDTKLDNMLFYGNDVLVIDLDTVMPSTILFDYGDMVRSFTSPAAEDEQDEKKTEFRTEHFNALTKGYLAGLNNSIVDIEKKNLLLGARAIIYEQSLRFLTDYLLGNPYYKVKYPEHNLVRTKTQVKLLSEIEATKNKLQKFILSL